MSYLAVEITGWRSCVSNCLASNHDGRSCCWPHNRSWMVPHDIYAGLLVRRLDVQLSEKGKGIKVELLSVWVGLLKHMPTKG